MLPAPLPQNEHERLAELASYGIFGTDPEEDYDQISRMLAAICGTPTAIISLVGQDELWFKSRINYDANRGPRNISFCGHAMLGQGVFVVEDATQDPRFADNPAVVEGGMRFYAGAPLLSESGYAIGTICTIDTQPRRLDNLQVEAIQLFARQVMAHMELRRANYQLQQQAAELMGRTKKLEQQADELRQLNLSKDRFFSIIAHDLKAPFQGILGFAELLDTDIDEMSHTEIRNIASYLHDTADGAFKLLDNLLHWSMVESGKIVYTPRLLLVETLFDLIEGSLSGVARHKQVGLSFECEHDLAVYGDENMLRSAIRNLVSNAIKFTPIGGHIAVRAYQNDQKIIFEIKDSGIGMTQIQMDHLFGSEHSHSTLGTAGESGTGLGLMLCKQFVQYHQGQIHVDSSIGDGSTFTIDIPVIPPLAHSRPTQAIVSKA
jgi:signal transduction histidine kinase